MSRVRQSDIDEGKREDPTSGAAADNRRFEQENRELEIAKEIPRRATSFFGAVLDPQHEIYLCSSTQINDDIVEGRKLGIDRVCRESQVVPNTYCAARGSAPLARSLSNAVLSGHLHCLWEINRMVSGVWKLLKAARRACIDIGCDHTVRLIKTLGIPGFRGSGR